MNQELTIEILKAQSRNEVNLMDLLKEFVLPEPVAPIDVELVDLDY